jgi:hypothetical protein
MIKDTISQLKEAVQELVFCDLQSINWTHKPSPEKWSAKEILGHLIDSAQINLQRFVRCTYEENFKLTYQQDEWVKAGRYQFADTQDLIDLWEMLNVQIGWVLGNYPPDRLQAKCDNSKTAVSLHTVEWLAEDYVAHMKHHLKQIYGSNN